MFLCFYCIIYASISIDIIGCQFFVEKKKKKKKKKLMSCYLLFYILDIYKLIKYIYIKYKHKTFFIVSFKLKVIVTKKKKKK